ncbi:hypothetical protein ACOME3_004909 [Neoechinorhynchus agilis]
MMILYLGPKGANEQLPQLAYIFIDDLRMENLGRTTIVDYLPPSHTKGTRRYAILVFEQRDGAIPWNLKFKALCTKYKRFRYKKLTWYYNFVPLYTLEFNVTAD